VSATAPRDSETAAPGGPAAAAAPGGPAATAAADLRALASPALDLGEVTRLVTALERAASPGVSVTIGLSGNVTIDLLGTYLRRHALLAGRTARILPGTFGDHLGNARRFADQGADAMLILTLLDAVMPAFEARLPLLGREEMQAAADRLRDELAIALEAARLIRTVIVGLVHRVTPRPAGVAADAVDDAVAAFNTAITTAAAHFENAQLLSTASIVEQLGVERSHDARSYLRFRAPWTPAFHDRLAEQAHRLTRNFGTAWYKAIVLDCDNTLWGGVLGEDLATGIALGPHGHPGSVYWQVQHQLLALQRRGVLLCLCSKNNPADVDAVLASHPGMILRDEHIVARRVNWAPKPDNLRSLVAELNIGLDALVFVDDSAFECEAVRSQLPEVHTVQVPASIADYSRLVVAIADLFGPPEAGAGAGTSDKTEQYRVRAQAAAERARFATQAQYLASLGLRVRIRRNDASSAPRIAELTQKSNQFNLTTRRYSLAEVRASMDSGRADVYSIEVADRFGDSGLTGVVITRPDETEPTMTVIDSFLMSCRVLGRDLELAPWPDLLAAARERGCTTLRAEYLPTAKNAQVRDFWDRLGLPLSGEDPDGRRTYQADLGDLAAMQLPARPPHVEVTCEFG
jgi:FkbH-like protein